MQRDLFFIRKTFNLAKKGIYSVSPNPLVAAIITKKDRMRMKTFRGIKHHYVRADFDGYDDRLLGADNDALKRIKFMSKSDLIREYRKQGKKFDPPQYEFRIKVVRSL